MLKRVDVPVAGRGRRNAFFAVLGMFLSATVRLSAQSFSAGVDTGVHLQSSSNTLRLVPGLGLTLGMTLEPLEVDARVFIGSFFGTSVFTAIDCFVLVPIGNWRPRIGLSLNLDWGDYYFFTQSADDLVRPTLPEAGIGITMKLCVLSFGRFRITAGRLFCGTSFEYFGRVLVVDLELFGLTYEL
jgi:hypothetical protein